MNQTLYILCGVPFSGKTTLAKAIVKAKKNVEHVYVDKFYNKNDQKNKEKAWIKAFRIAYQETENALKQGKSVIFDATNFLKKERDKIRKIANDLGVENRVVLIDVPRNAAKSRLLENRKNQHRKNVSDSDWEEVTTQFETPESDENVIIYDQQKDDLKNWIEKNIK